MTLSEARRRAELTQDELAERAGIDQTTIRTNAWREAFGYKSFKLLMAGYFVCCFHLVFIGVHLPSYLKDKGLMDPNIAVAALALIALPV